MSAPPDWRLGAATISLDRFPGTCVHGLELLSDAEAAELPAHSALARRRASQAKMASGLASLIFWFFGAALALAALSGMASSMDPSLPAFVSPAEVAWGALGLCAFGLLRHHALDRAWTRRARIAACLSDAVAAHRPAIARAQERVALESDCPPAPGARAGQRRL
jgi:hypothetical protein